MSKICLISDSENHAFEKFQHKEKLIFKTATHLNHNYPDYVPYTTLKLRFSHFQLYVTFMGKFFKFCKTGSFIMMCMSKKHKNI